MKRDINECAESFARFATLSMTMVSGASAAEAQVSKGDETYRFVVVQCLQNVSRPGSKAVVELQLDGVPVETPTATIEQMKGVVNDPAAAGKLLQEVVSAGPVLSVTRLQNGGDLIGVSDLSETNWTSDPSVTDGSARFLMIDRSGTTRRVTGESQSDGQAVLITAECPD